MSQGGSWSWFCAQNLPDLRFFRGPILSPGAALQQVLSIFRGYLGKPLKINDKPMKINDKPMKINDKPMMFNEKPIKIHEIPMEINEKPMIINKKQMKIHENHSSPENNPKLHPRFFIAKTICSPDGTVPPLHSMKIEAAKDSIALLEAQYSPVGAAKSDDSI